jgi:hypothetical protein
MLEQHGKTTLWNNKVEYQNGLTMWKDMLEQHREIAWWNNMIKHLDGTP